MQNLIELVNGGNQMKKAVSVLVLLTFALTVFSFGVVHGADYQLKAVQTGSATTNGVTISTEIIQLYTHIDSQPIYEGSAYVPFLYTTLITNNTDTNKLIGSIKVAARYQNLGNRYLSNIENMSPDLTQSISTLAGNGWFDILPSSTFSVENGTLIPPHRTLSCVCVVYMNCEYMYSNTSQTYVPVVPAFEGDAYVRLQDVLDGSQYDFFGDGGDGIDYTQLTNALRDFIGDTTNGDLIDYLNTISTGIGSTNTYLDVVVARLNTIISNLNAWNGTIPTYNPWTSYTTSATMPNEPFDSVSWCTLYAQPSFEFSEDFEKLTSTTSYFNYTTVIPVQLTYYYECTETDYYLLANPTLTINSVFKKNNGYSIVGGTLRSNFASVVRWNSNSTEYNLQIYTDIDDIHNGDVFILTYDFYIVYSDTNWSYWQTGTLNCTSLISQTSTDNSISAQSQTIVQQNNTVHQQEQAWFNQNNQALQNVGLGNYNFDVDGSTGVGGVSNDFTDLFNALGKWNSVYIFSMTLTVALTIIRYQVVSSKKKK